MIKVQFYTKINTKNGFRGAQLKTWDYFNFINSHPKFEARIKFHESSEWSDDVTWDKELVLSGGELFEQPDLLVLKGGQDWLLFQKYINYTNIPVISPIVNYRVLNESHLSNQLLKNTAVRVCPNPDLMNKLILCPQVDSPVVCIPHGVKSPSKITPLKDRNIDILIVAIKNKELGKKIFNHYKSYLKNVMLIDKFTGHQEFISKMADSKVALHLPQTVESFYIPGLESLSMGTMTIMPDCLGNRDYTNRIAGGYLAHYGYDELIQKTDVVLSMPQELLCNYSEQAHKDSKSFSIDTERQHWYDLIEQEFNL